MDTADILTDVQARLSTPQSATFWAVWSHDYDDGGQIDWVICVTRTREEAETWATDYLSRWHRKALYICEEHYGAPLDFSAAVHDTGWWDFQPGLTVA